VIEHSNDEGVYLIVGLKRKGTKAQRKGWKNGFEVGVYTHLFKVWTNRK